MNVDLEVSGDARAGQVGGRNISEAERWASIAAGTGMALYGISRRRPDGWVLAALGGLLLRRGVTGHCHTYGLFGIDTAHRSDTRRALGGRAGVNVEERIIVNRPHTELYRFWRRLENLPRFMTHLESVERITDTISRWRAKGPGGTTVEWNAEIINDVPDQIIAWRSIDRSDVVSAGSVHFDPAGRGRTLVRVRLQYSPPGGKLGAAVAKTLRSDAATEIREDLLRFKLLAEEHLRSES